MMIDDVEESTLFRHVGFGRWEDAIARSISHPVEARYLTDNNLTPLHCATYMCDPPVDVVDALIKAYPEATMMCTKDGYIPLHYALCTWSEKGVRRLMGANMAAINVICRGFSPLINLSSVYERKINAAARRKLQPSQDLSALTEEGPDLPVIVKTFPQPLDRIWSNACLIVKALSHGSIDDKLPNGEVFRALHAFAGLERVPVGLLRLALRVRRDELLEKDENGNLPLHIAIKSAIIRDLTYPKRKFKERRDGEEARNTIDFFALAEPTAARIRNRQGEFPLHMGLQYKIGWRRGLEDIFKAFPGAVVESDIDTGLYPFMIASVGKHASLDIAYSLLRACPELERFSGDPAVIRMKNEIRRVEIRMQRSVIISCICVLVAFFAQFVWMQSNIQK